jgi:hypothetical protein
LLSVSRQEKKKKKKEKKEKNEKEGKLKGAAAFTSTVCLSCEGSERESVADAGPKPLFDDVLVGCAHGSWFVLPFIWSMYPSICGSYH